jgi:hypothetical protein
VIVPGSSGLNLDTLAPGPITPAGHDIIEYFRDGDRKMVRVGLKAQLPPSSSNYEGVHVYAEVPDGSDPANPRTKAGAFVAGVHRANKDFAPVDLSRHPHQASSHYVAVVVVDEPSSNVSARFYGASYGKVENQLVPADQPNATPSSRAGWFSSLLRAAAALSRPARSSAGTSPASPSPPTART